MFRAALLALLTLAPVTSAAEPPELKTVTWKVGDDTREALVYAPAGSGKKPVIFAWHGHGGTDGVLTPLAFLIVGYGARDLRIIQRNGPLRVTRVR